MSEHLFITSSGDLHDTRDPNWTTSPLRVAYRRTFGRIETTAELKSTLRAGPYVWPGGYPLFFFTSDGGALSFKTVRDELRQVLDSIRHGIDDGWRVVGCGINWEDTSLFDDHTGDLIESAYGEV